MRERERARERESERESERKREGERARIRAREREREKERESRVSDGENEHWKGGTAHIKGPRQRDPMLPASSSSSLCAVLLMQPER